MEIPDTLQLKANEFESQLLHHLEGVILQVS